MARPGGSRFERVVAMTTTKHERTVHIDAAVDEVFDYVKDPRHFFESFNERDKSHTELTDVKLTPEGVGSTYSWKSSVFFLHPSGVSTREEYIPDHRIVDRSSTGPVWTFAVEPDSTGTALSLSYEYSTKVPLMDKIVDRVVWNGDRGLEAMLRNMKTKIETEA